ncbi:Cyclin-dependent kinase 12 [Datura stramonium]|uniref:Cyclin-dependent kinase 12 n=1 Tax=Datura stramonium TaxID=4076 RepID=A0ABS8RS92_DATST|nr:Cyclin-dependent kinase 12 [Datura stramonium]
MGCVQGKGYGFSTERLERMKVENGYVKRGGVGKQHVQQRRQQQQQTRDMARIREQEGNGRNHVVEDQEKRIGRDQKEKIKGRDGIGNDQSQRGTSGNGRKIGGDELVNGWPKWLVDNIPKEVLVGLVPKTADSYEKLAKIGQGTYSNVYKARDRKSGKIVALKKVRFDTSEPESVKFMAREIIILKRVDHPNIIKLEGLATSRMQYSLYLVFDFMESDLTKLINRTQGKLTEPQETLTIYQVGPTCDQTAKKSLSPEKPPYNWKNIWTYQGCNTLNDEGQTKGEGEGKEENENNRIV